MNVRALDSETLEGPPEGTEDRMCIRGLCPRCREWFPCDDWFDNSVPLPACPRCRLMPTEIQCHSAAGTLSIAVDGSTGLHAAAGA